VYPLLLKLIFFYALMIICRISSHSGTCLFLCVLRSIWFVLGFG